MCIVTIFCPASDVKNLEINLPKDQDKNFNILRTKRAFKVKSKAFFTIFKGLSVVKDCLIPETGPLNLTK